MSLSAIIPVKSLNKGKSRLSDIFSDEERKNLNSNLLKKTIITISSMPLITKIFVISSDPHALAIARDLGAKTIQENKSTGINRSLRKATKVAKAYKSNKVIIIPADIPLLNKSDIQKVIEKSSSPPQIVIVPDRYDRGTNILLINPIGILDYEFGDSSFIRHIEQAQRKNIQVDVVRLESLGLDVDFPDDFNEAMKKSRKIINLAKQKGEKT